MNYKFRDAVIQFIANGEISAEKFVNNINVTNIDYPEQSIYSLQNLIDSHDTTRFLTTANKNKDKLKLAALLQFTYPGAPMIYYGDEIGMYGGSDPDNRRTMIWEERENGEKPDKDLYNYYSKLAEIREKEEVLINGDLSFIVPQDSRQAVILVRENENEKIYTVINAWDRKQKISFKLPENKSTIKDLISGREFKTDGSKLNIEVEKLRGMIFKF